jgi:hypothetical protein
LWPGDKEPLLPEYKTQQLNNGGWVFSAPFETGSRRRALMEDRSLSNTPRPVVQERQKVVRLHRELRRIESNAVRRFHNVGNESVAVMRLG